jgi:hypothetical protein
LKGEGKRNKWKRKGGRQKCEVMQTHLHLVPKLRMRRNSLNSSVQLHCVVKYKWSVLLPVLFHSFTSWLIGKHAHVNARDVLRLSFIFMQSCVSSTAATFGKRFSVTRLLKSSDLILCGPCYIFLRNFKILFSRTRL